VPGSPYRKVRLDRLLSKEHTLRTPIDPPLVVVLGAHGWNITTACSSILPGWGFCPGGWGSGGLGQARYWVLESQTLCWVWFLLIDRPAGWWSRVRGCWLVVFGSGLRIV